MERRKLSPKMRFFIAQIDEDGSTEWKAGNQRGYTDINIATRIAKKLANKTRRSHVIGEYTVYPDGEREHNETVGYEHPDE